MSSKNRPTDDEQDTITTKCPICLELCSEFELRRNRHQHQQNCCDMCVIEEEEAEESIALEEEEYGDYDFIEYTLEDMEEDYDDLYKFDGAW